MIETIKKYKWVIFLALAFASGFLIKWFFTPPNTSGEVNRLKEEVKVIVERHKSDSVRYVKTSDSLVQIINKMVGNVYEKEKQLAYWKSHFQVVRDSIVKLPPTDAVKYFSERTCSTSELTDKGVISPIQSIYNANVIFVERDDAVGETTQLRAIVSTQDSIITNQTELIGIKDKRIAGITNDYYSIQRVNSDLNSVIKKQKRNIRTKNAVVGILSGVTIGAIVVTLLR